MGHKKKTVVNKNQVLQMKAFFLQMKLEWHLILAMEFTASCLLKLDYSMQPWQDFPSIQLFVSADSWFKSFLSLSYLNCSISLALNTYFLVLYFFKILIQVHGLSSLKIVSPLRKELFLIKACALLKVSPKSNIID